MSIEIMKEGIIFSNEEGRLGVIHNPYWENNLDKDQIEKIKNVLFDNNLASTRVFNTNSGAAELDTYGGIIQDKFKGIIEYHYLMVYNSKSIDVKDGAIYFVTEEYNRNTGISNITKTRIGYLDK